VHKIAVLRANALGDLIFALPALEALRNAYRGAEITLLGRSMHAELLSGRPSPIDRVIVLPAIKGVSVPDSKETDEPAAAACLQELRAEGFDIAVQLHGGGGNSNHFLRRLGAALTVGLKSPEAEALDRWIPYFYYQHEVLRYVEVVSLLGAAPPTLEPHLAVIESDLVAASPVLDELSGPFAVLHPGASDRRRRWPAERFAAVGDRLAEAGAGVVVTATSEEAPVVEEVLARMAHPAVDACDRLSLSGLVGLLSRAAVLISNDTGPLHLAGAVGAATVGVFWCGNMLNGAPLTRARHRPFPAWQSSCPVCGRQASEPRCEHDPSFVTEVSIDDVAGAALDLWASGRATPSPLQQ
jgi:ADP-heptose:LPS heptosyltransferase